MTKRKTYTPAEVRLGIRGALSERKDADAAWQTATNDLGAWLERGVAAGIPAKELRELAGLSKQGYYDVLKRPRKRA